MNSISPKYLMSLIKRLEAEIALEYENTADQLYYIKKWHVVDEQSNWDWENFSIIKYSDGELNLRDTLHNINGEILLRIAVDLGVETPDFIPSVVVLKNDMKSSYKNANLIFEEAFKLIESQPDTAIGLANSALESIVKEIFKDKRIATRIKDSDTLYDLTSNLLKEFQFFPNAEMPIEIRTIGSSLISVNQSIEKIRSTKTRFHGKAGDDYFIDDVMYTYYIINSITTVGLFLNSFYKKKYPPIKNSPTTNSITPESVDDLPF